MQTIWTGNGQATSQVEQVTVISVPAGGGGVLSASINGKMVTYTTTASDLVTTAAAAWQALLSNTSTAPPEFQEQAWTVTNNVVTSTAQVAGTPYTVTFSASGGAVISSAIIVPNSSPSDVTNPANWLRGGLPMLPQNGDDVTVANSSVPMLWNLNGLAGVQLNSFTRWQSMTGTIGLPENNPNGYYEYRPTYFQLCGVPGIPLNMTLGQGATGSGPGRERYNVGQQCVLLNVLAAGGALDDFAVRFLGGNGANVLRIVGTSVGVAMLPGEQAALATATVDGGGSLSLGPGVLYGQSVSVPTSSSSSCAPSSSLTPAAGGTVTAIGSALTLFSAPGLVCLKSGAQGTVMGSGLTYPSVQALGGSILTWSSNSSIGALILTAASTLDKSGDVQPMQVGTLVIDADTCQVLDPNNAITWTGPITLNNALTFGPFQLGTGRKLTIQ